MLNRHKAWSFLKNLMRFIAGKEPVDNIWAGEEGKVLQRDWLIVLSVIIRLPVGSAIILGFSHHPKGNWVVLKSF